MSVPLAVSPTWPMQVCCSGRRLSVTAAVIAQACVCLFAPSRRVFHSLGLWSCTKRARLVASPAADARILPRARASPAPSTWLGRRETDGSYSLVGVRRSGRRASAERRRSAVNRPDNHKQDASRAASFCRHSSLAYATSGDDICRCVCWRALAPALSRTLAHASRTRRVHLAHLRAVPSLAKMSTDAV